jgi:hypothetical protein
VTVLAAEMQPRRRAQLPAPADALWTQAPGRSPGVTIVKWRVYADKRSISSPEHPAQPGWLSDTRAREVR